MIFMRTFIINLIFNVIIIFIVSFPLYAKITSSPSGAYFPLIHQGILTQDYYFDLAMMRLGRSVFTELDPYTTENVAPTWVHIFDLTAGKVGGWLNVSDPVMYYIALYSGLILFFIFIYFLVREVVPPDYQILALFLIYFASPFPQFTTKIFGQPLSIGDSWWTYMNIYSRFFVRPMHQWGEMLMVACTYFYLMFYRTHKTGYMIATAICCSIGLLIATAPELIFLAVIGCISIYLLFAVIRRNSNSNLKKLLIGSITIIISALPVLAFMYYQMITSQTGYIVQTWEVSFRYESNPTIIWVYLAGIGLMFPLGIIGIFKIIKQLDIKRIFIALMALMPIFLYLLSVNGILNISKLRFAYSAPYVFWGILAVYGLRMIIMAIPINPLKGLLKGIVIFLFVGNSFLGLNAYWIPLLSTPTNYYSNIYLSSDYLETFKYINARVPRFAHIMTDFFTGMIIPAFTDTTVYIGHETSTIDSGRKTGISNTFYWGGLTLDQVIELFKRDKIEYVWWDKPSPPIQYESVLQKVFQAGEVTLYKVVLN
jgi:hypothetical protein